jgi:glycosyltransferase involved in cell wall biosynthesis
MRIVIMDGCDYQSMPIGGQLSFCKQLVSVFSPEEIVLVGVASVPSEPVGVWFKRNIEGETYDCFNLYRLDQSKKPRIPLRIRNFLSMIRYRRTIIDVIHSDTVFIQSPELMIGFSILNRKKQKIAYFFHGVENPLNNPRYAWGRTLSGLFWLVFIYSLKKSNCNLAAADTASIQEAFRSHPLLEGSVSSFPTRFDDSVFKKQLVPKNLTEKFSRFDNIIVTTGRINNVKGWDFLLHSFQSFKESQQEFSTCLIFVGDGEDGVKLKEMVIDMDLQCEVFVTGFVNKEVVSEYLNLADLYVVGSKVEGWSIAMLEALACGLPIVSTEVSGAKELIKNGENGYVYKERNPEAFGEGIYLALKNMRGINDTSLTTSENYKLSTLKPSLLLKMFGKA